MNENFNQLIEKNINGVFGQKGSKLTYGNKDLLKFIDKQNTFDEKIELFYQIIDAHIIEKKGIQNIRKLIKEFSSLHDLNDNIAVLYIREHVAKKYNSKDINEVLHSLQLLKDEVDFKITDYDLSYQLMSYTQLSKEQIQKIKPEFTVMALAYLSEKNKVWNSFNSQEQTRFLEDCLLYMPYTGSQYYRKHINVLIKNANIDWLDNEKSNLLITCCNLDQIKVGGFIISRIKKEIDPTRLDTVDLFSMVTRSDSVSQLYTFLLENSNLSKIFEANGVYKDKLNIELIAEKRKLFKNEDVKVIEYYINNVAYDKRISDAIGTWFEKNNLPDIEKIKMENALLKKDSETMTFNAKIKNRL